MSQFMNTLTWTMAIKLYHAKMKAEKRRDLSAINSLKQQYPDLFTEQFNVYIEKAKRIAFLLDCLYNENFLLMFDLESDSVEILH